MLDKLKTLINNKNFYLKLIATVLFISLIPTLFISVIVYSKAKAAMEKQLYAANLMYLEQTINTVELIVNQISDSCKQLVLDKSFNDYVNFYSGSYYETLSGELKEEDLARLERYIDAKKRMYERLYTFKLSNEFMYSVYFYDKSKNIVFTSNGLQYDLNSFYDKDWYDTFVNSFNTLSFMDTRKLTLQDNSDINVLTIVSRPVVNNSQDYCLVINIDAGYLYKNIVERLNVRENLNFLALSKNDTITLHKDINMLYKSSDTVPYLKDITNENNTSQKAIYNGKRVQTYSMKSNLLGWKFITAVDLEQFYEAVSFLKLFIILFTIIFILFTIFFALLIVRRIYNPISSVVQLIKNKYLSSGNFQEGMQRSGEIGFIRESLEKNFSQTEYLQVKLKESMPAYRDRFLNTLISPYNNYSIEEIKKHMEFFSIKIADHDLILMLLCANFKENPVCNLEDIGIIKLMITCTINSIISACYEDYYVNESNEGEFVIVVNIKNENINELINNGQKIIEEIKRNNGIACTIGISRHCNNITELSRAYEEASEALKYRIVSELNDVISFCDIKLGNKPSYRYPVDKEATMNNYIKNADAENAKIVFKDIVGQIVPQLKNMHYIQVQHIFSRLLNNFMDTINTLGLDTEMIFRTNSSPYDILYSKNNPDEIIHWFNECIDAISSRIDTSIKDKSNRHVEEVIDIIKSNYHEDISLSYIADRLNLNSAYISRIFKEHTGSNFLEYLTSYRIEVSKKLLLETDMMIKDISQKVGYTNNYYFIKIFKDYTGVTPGGFKKMNL